MTFQFTENIKVSLISKINCLEEYSIDNSSWEGPNTIYNYKVLTSEIEFTINTSKWNIPFQYIFSNDNNGFYKRRVLNLPLFKVEKLLNYESLIRVLLLLDTNQISKIESSSFHKITVDDLFSEKDHFIFGSLNSVKYEIRLYPEIAKTEISFLNNQNKWIIPHININGLGFPGEIIRHFSIVNLENQCSINIVPENYSSSFCKPISNQKEMLMALYGTKSKYHLFYTGSFTECENSFNDKNSLNGFLNTIVEKSKKQQQNKNNNDSFDYYNTDGWKEDYFNTMTDGQLGDYNDFEGNIDEIDNLTRG